MQNLNYTFGYDSFETAESAINYDGRSYYNPPVTIDIDGKVFILGCGTSDDKNVVVEGKTVYVICENSGLEYIALTRINLDSNEVDEAYLQGNDINDYKIFNKTLKQKLTFLKEYLPY